MEGYFRLKGLSDIIITKCSQCSLAGSQFDKHTIEAAMGMTGEILMQHRLDNITQLLPTNCNQKIKGKRT